MSRLPEGWASLAPVWWERDWTEVRTLVVAVDPDRPDWLRAAQEVTAAWRSEHSGVMVRIRTDQPADDDPEWQEADEVLDLRDPGPLANGLSAVDAVANMLGWRVPSPIAQEPGPVHAVARPGMSWEDVLSTAVAESGGEAPVRVLDRGGWLPDWVTACRGVTIVRDAPLRLRWEGSFFCWHSLSIINRALCDRLLRRGHELSLVPYEPDQFDPMEDPLLAKLALRVSAPLSGPAEVHVRHQWPPKWSPPAEGSWVMIQPWEFGGAPRTWVEEVNAGVDAMVVPTAYVRDGYVASGMPAGRVRVVPNGVDLARFHPGAAPWPVTGTRGTRFLFVGGSIPRKGVDVLLEAWALAFTDEDDVSLVIKDLGASTVYRGQTAGRSIAAEAARAGGAPIIHLTEEVPDEHLPGLYTAADVLVHPYRGEGFGMPIAEAMACGLPVVVTGHGAALDFVDEEVGWLIPARVLPTRLPDDLPPSDAPFVLAEPDPVALAGLLRVVAEQASERIKCGAAGRRRVEAGLTWDAIVDGLEDLLKSVAAATPVRAAEAAAEERPGIRIEGLDGRAEVWLPRYGDRSWERALRRRLASGPNLPLVVWFDTGEGWCEEDAISRLSRLLEAHGPDIADVHIVVEDAKALDWRVIHDVGLPVGPPGRNG
ncbi:MAG: glycosyltransferase family 4 protein [Candidatus Sericytochromatia bacterium]|nr:glycosyltransferase family 4 protein [Candidatus Sericytochromatia bacterium]